MRRRSSAAVVLLLIVVPAFAGASGRHPDAPPETDQFAFLIGEWDCTIRSIGPDGALGPESKARWVGRWDLGGWAIRDDWTSAGGMGFNIRSCNPRTQKWDNRWLQAGNLLWKYYEAEKVATRWS